MHNKQAQTLMHQ